MSLPKRLMKALFLDIDGVLNHLNSPKRNGIWVIDPENVKHLNSICASIPDLIIVLSSTWRFPHAKGRVDINKELKDAGYTGPEITEMTTLSTRDAFRGQEIQAWLDEHPEVDSFIILDDDSDMLHLEPRLIQTDFYKGPGLQAHHSEKAIDMLSNKQEGQDAML